MLGLGWGALHQFVTVSYSGSIVHTLTEEVPNYYSHIPVLMILGQFTVSITYDLPAVITSYGPVILSIVYNGKAYAYLRYWILLILKR